VLSARNILKVDFWGKNIAKLIDRIPGASNFRKIPAFPIYGVAQPTIRGIRNCLQALNEDLRRVHMPNHIIWINLREEPLIYINGTPYVLRDQYLQLRNMNSYSGITPARLEMIENRLSQDILGELEGHEGKILLHSEFAEHTIPRWEECEADNVKTIKEVMEDFAVEGVKIEYFRVPVTAERAPDNGDFDYLLKLITRHSKNDTAIVVNCQVGMGRSTTGTIIATLIYNWLGAGGTPSSPMPLRKIYGSDIDLANTDSFVSATSSTKRFQRVNYTIINTLLRVVKNGIPIIF
jgi:hypothetical protein